jgi:LPS export ABC transporter protein LptC
MWKNLIVLIVLIFCSCSQKKNSNIILSGDSAADSISQVINFSTITAYRDGNKIWELSADEIIQISDSKRIKANPVKMLIYGDSSKVNAVVTADSGISNENNDSLFLWGNVRIDAKSGEKLSSNSLEWRKREKILTSNDFVEISTSDGEIMRGKGFRADEGFEWWEFAKEVSGKFPSIEAEFGKDGE